MHEKVMSSRHVLYILGIVIVFENCNGHMTFYHFLPASRSRSTVTWSWGGKGTKLQIYILSNGKQPKQFADESAVYRNIFEVGQHPIDGADGPTDGTKLQIYRRISCC